MVHIYILTLQSKDLSLYFLKCIIFLSFVEKSIPTYFNANCLYAVLHRYEPDPGLYFSAPFSYLMAPGAISHHPNDYSFTISSDF